MQASYWNTILRQRLTRRRALAASGTAAVSAAFLAACGGDDSGDSGSSSSGLITEPVDVTKQAKKGGLLKQATGEESTSWDPTQSGSQLRAELNSMLIRAKSAVGKAPSGEFEGDLAESWEVSPDKLQLTFRIRSNAHFAPLPPTNGRAVTIEDLKLSFDYYEKFGNRAGDMFASVAAGAPIDSISTPDSRTFVIKLRQPDVIIMDLLSRSNYTVALPKEGISGQYELKTLPRGSGPLYVKEHQPSSRTVLEKNPGYHLDGPFISTWEHYYLKEYAAMQAQFRTGGIYMMNPDDVRIADLLPLKREVPEISMFKEPITATQGQQFFGYSDHPLNIFRDERMRQALSMSYDRDLWIDTFHDISNFAKEGIALETRWSPNGVSCNVQGDWVLDPKNEIKGRELGENAKFFKHDIAEAKKLMAAAGFANGATTESHHVTTADYGIQTPKMLEVLLQMAADAGFKISIHPEAYSSTYRTAYRDTKGNFAGMTAGRTSLANDDDPTQRFFAQYHREGDLFRGFDVNGQKAGAGDPYLDDLTLKMRQEFDLKKRVALAWELQRYDAKKTYYIRFPGGAEAFSMAWPAVANFRVYEGGTPWWYYWMDDSKAPLKKA